MIGIKVGYQLPGDADADFKRHEKYLTAALLKAFGGKLIFRAEDQRPADKSEIYVWHSNSGGTSYPWRVSKRHIVGSRGAEEMQWELDEFSTFREAVREAKQHARKLAR